MLTPDSSVLTGHRLMDNKTSDLFAPLAGEVHVALAVSGGADSAALMHLAHRWKCLRPEAPEISILTVDHGLRAGAAGEARQVGAWARALGLPHHILNWRGDKPERGLQEAARRARYGLMCGWCRDHGASSLVLAHHRQDQAETLMMRAGRGSGEDGMCGMARESRREGVSLARPLLGLTPVQLRDFLRDAGHDWIEDPSNHDRRYERVRVRRRLETSAGARQQADDLLNTAEGLIASRDRLEARVDALLIRSLNPSDGGFCDFDAGAFRAEPEDICFRALRRIVLAVGGGAYAPRRAALTGLAERMIAGNDKGATVGGCRFLRRGGRIWAMREARGMQSGLELRSGASIIWDNRFAVRVASDDESPVTVKALGGADWPVVRRRFGGPLESLPAGAGRSLPAFYRKGRLLAVPLTGMGGRGFEADFIQKWRLQGHSNPIVKPFRSR